MDEDQKQSWVDATCKGDIPRLKELLASGMDINDNSNRLHKPAIIIATDKNQIDTVRFLLEHGAEVDARGDEAFLGGPTALMLASRGGYEKLVKLLIKSRADLNATNKDRQSAYDFAKMQGQWEIIRNLWKNDGRPGRPNTVLVLGAGFTKAFYNKAPLLVDTFEKIQQELIPKYTKFGAAKKLLEAELKQQAVEYPEDKGRINLERLMTRLAGGMPYDTNEDRHILNALLDDVIDILIERIRKTREGDITDPKTELKAVKGTYITEELEVLENLAEYCLRQRVNFITFNYDDMLDEALNAAAETSQDHSIKRGWNPNHGYGFYCRPVYDLIGLSDSKANGSTISLVLKLHGSMSWYAKRGAAKPYSVDDIVHKSPWSISYKREMGHITGIDNGWLYSWENEMLVKDHIEPVPFIVPPILTKTDLNEQPILQLIWTRAYELLQQADQVIFIGYSLPVTDIAAAQLFSEARGPLYPTIPVVQVVNYAAKKGERGKIKSAYRRVYPRLSDDCFHFDGALEWAKRFVDEDGATLKPPAGLHSQTIKQ